MSILDTLKIMDKEKVKSLLIFKDQSFLSLLTIGDIQRAIIANVDINSEINDILDFNNKKYCTIDESKENIKSKMVSMRAECMPILNANGELVDIVYWTDTFPDKSFRNNADINLPVIIMAGGKGTRLSPLTNVLPKPLIPIGEKTIIEDIMDKFVSVGCSDFHISVNYKAEMMKYYLDGLNNPNYNILYFQEVKPLGTAGSLTLLKNRINTTFFVSNCDIIVEEDYSQIYNYHKQNKNEITLVAAMKYLKIPYGTIETKEDGLLDSMKEKPEFVFKINAGLYILEPHLLNEIPDNTFFHITELIENLRSQGRRVGVFPVSETSWTDIGEWDEYLKLINK